VIMESAAALRRSVNDLEEPNLRKGGVRLVESSDERGWLRSLEESNDARGLRWWASHGDAVSVPLFLLLRAGQTYSIIR
jgi:hypothetical protein